jgi:hypothetical protein
MQVPIALVLGQSCTPHPVLDTVCFPNSPMANSGGPSIALHSTLIISHDCDLGGYLNPCAKVVQYFPRIADCQHNAYTTVSVRGVSQVVG